jgi:hypothetical protein
MLSELLERGCCFLWDCIAPFDIADCRLQIVDSPIANPQRASRQIGAGKAEAAAFSIRAEVLSGGIVRRARGFVEFWGAPDFSGADKSYWGKVLDVGGYRRFCVVAR